MDVKVLGMINIQKKKTNILKKGQTPNKLHQTALA